MNKNWIYISFGLFVFFFMTFYVANLLWFRGLIHSEKGSANAVVTKYEKLNHSSVFYSYDVRSEIYSGVGSAQGYQVGDEIDVLYILNKPHISGISENIPSPSELLLMATFAATFFTGFLVLVFKLNSWVGAHPRQVESVTR